MSKAPHPRCRRSEATDQVIKLKSSRLVEFVTTTSHRNFGVCAHKHLELNLMDHDGNCLAAFCNAGKERKQRERERCKNTHTHTRTHAHAHTCMNSCIHPLSFSHTSRTCTHAHTHTHTHTHTITHTHAYAKICMSIHNQARTLAKWKQHLHSENNLTFYSLFA